MNAARPLLGLDLGGTKTEALLLSPDGRERWRLRVATPSADYDDLLRMLQGLVQQARVQAGGELSIGIGTPGSATADGRMKNCNTQALNGRELQRDLERAFGQPVVVENDANCLALSEATDGAAAGAAVVFAAIVGTGTGAGLALHGRVHRGPNGVAGEWGHNPLPWAVDGEDPRFECYCGQRGCIETVLSGPGLARDHAAVTGQVQDAAAIAAAAAAGDLAAQASLQRHAHRMARALASVINVLDPDVIVLGGGVSRMAHLYDAVPRLWGRWVVSGGVADAVRTPLRPALHGDASGVRGAAWLGRTSARN